MQFVKKKIQIDFVLTVNFILLISERIKKCECDNWEYILAKNLFKGYDLSIRPSLIHSDTLNVTFGLGKKFSLCLKHELSQKNKTHIQCGKY